MRYSPIPSELFKGNRQRFEQTLPPGALAVFHSNDIYPTNADGTRSFIQNSDLFWLTGIDQEETVLVVFPDAPRKTWKELLFVKRTDSMLETWEGFKLSKEEAAEVSGIRQVHWTSSFFPILKRLLGQTDLVFLPHNTAAHNIDLADANVRFARWCRERYPLHQFRNACGLLHDLRLVKSDIEVELMRKACEITGAGFRRALQVMRPGIKEYEIEAEFAHEFIRSGSRGFAYEPIIGSGDNSCILHYTSNDDTCRAGEVVLMDVGASYANYAADMSRTIPVSGTFSPRQRAVYNSVLRCLEEATALMVKGTTVSEHHAAVEKIVEKELVDLGLLSMDEIRRSGPGNPALARYFMHKTTHSIGLDVHDVGDRDPTFAAGMVFTCEPGIYIREEEIGIRLENNILITENGNLNLMENIPVHPEEIEDLMSNV